MPLTNVFTRNGKGEWVRTTAAMMDHEYVRTVSAVEHAFRCHHCFQYVIFVKGTSERVSHFKHSRGEENKDCEDRSFGTGGYTYGTDIMDVPDPMRLRIEAGRPVLEIGLFPVSAAVIEKAMRDHMVVRIRGSFGSPDEYRVDWTRFEPHTTTWLRLPFSCADDYKVEIDPRDRSVLTWEIKRTPVSKQGTVFDASTGRRIAERSDISLNRDYYVLCKSHGLHSCKGIRIGQRIDVNGSWGVYPLRITSYTEQTSDYCFDYLHLRLTEVPSDIVMLWPPAVENEDLIDTNWKHIFMYVKGESDFETYPSYGTRSKSVYQIQEQEQIVELRIVSTLQMVSTTRYSQRLKFLFIRPWESVSEIVEPSLQVWDDLNHEVEDVLRNVPIRGILRILSSVDATVDVEDKGGFLYRLELTSGEERRIQDLKKGDRLTIRQGMDVRRRIQIGVEQKQVIPETQSMAMPWHGRMVPMPRRYAWVLSRMDPAGELYQKTVKALKDGIIPQEGLRYINRIVGGL